MKPIQTLLTMGALLLTCAFPALAQYKAPRAQKENTDKSKPTSLVSNYGSVGLFPVAVFDTAGLFQSGVAGTKSLEGTLLSVDLGHVDKAGSDLSLGGWYWGRAGSDLYEIHARGLLKSGLGLQVGHLNTTQGFIVRPGLATGITTDADAWDFFLVYELDSTKLHRGSNMHNWNVTFGAGIFLDNTPHLIGSIPQGVSTNRTGNFTFFASGSLQISPRFSILLSDWIIRDRSLDLNRVALGIGYSF